METKKEQVLSDEQIMKIWAKTGSVLEFGQAMQQTLLAAQLAAKPVAWYIPENKDSGGHWTDHEPEVDIFKSRGVAVVPLYSSPVVGQQTGDEKEELFGMTIAQAKEYIEQLEIENEAEYVARGADAYNHSCSELEGWQEKRLKKHLDAGPRGTLIGWMDWAQEIIDKYHSAPSTNDY